VASEILFVYDFDLLVDHLPGEPVDRHVPPVMLLALDEEIIFKASGVWLIRRDHTQIL
jgi:hypothetical protein